MQRVMGLVGRPQVKPLRMIKTYEWPQGIGRLGTKAWNRWKDNDRHNDSLLFKRIHSLIVSLYQYLVRAQNNKKGNVSKVSKTLNLRWGKQPFFTLGLPLFFQIACACRRSPTNVNREYSHGLRPSSWLRVVESSPSWELQTVSALPVCIISNCLTSEWLDAINPLRWIRKQNERAKECTMD